MAQMLDVSFNDLRVEGANSLALVLSIHTSLTEISLRGNGIGSQGVRSLIASLVKHPRIRALDLADNDLNSEALKYVCEGLPQVVVYCQFVAFNLCHVFPHVFSQYEPASLTWI